jgi:hypothetical protein
VLGTPHQRAGLRHGLDEVLTIARFRHGDAKVTFGQGDDVTVILSLSHGQHSERRCNGSWSKKRVDIGSITIVDPQEEPTFSIKGKADVLQLFLRREIILEATGMDRVPPIRSCFHEHDPGIERCIFQTLVAIRNGEAHDLLLTDIAHRLAIRVAERWLSH